MYYLSRTRSWVKPTIWLPSPPMGLTMHIGAHNHGELRGVCYPLIIWGPLLFTPPPQWTQALPKRNWLRVPLLQSRGQLSRGVN